MRITVETVSIDEEKPSLLVTNILKIVDAIFPQIGFQVPPSRFLNTSSALVDVGALFKMSKELFTLNDAEFKEFIDKYSKFLKFLRPGPTDFLGLVECLYQIAEAISSSNWIRLNKIYEIRTEILRQALNCCQCILEDSRGVLVKAKILIMFIKIHENTREETFKLYLQLLLELMSEAWPSLQEKGLIIEEIGKFYLRLAQKKPEFAILERLDALIKIIVDAPTDQLTSIEKANLHPLKIRLQALGKEGKLIREKLGIMQDLSGPAHPSESPVEDKESKGLQKSKADLEKNLNQLNQKLLTVNNKIADAKTQLIEFPQKRLKQEQELFSEAEAHFARVLELQGKYLLDSQELAKNIQGYELEYPAALKELEKCVQDNKKLEEEIKEEKSNLAKSRVKELRKSKETPKEIERLTEIRNQKKLANTQLETQISALQPLPTEEKSTTGVLVQESQPAVDDLKAVHQANQDLQSQIDELRQKNLGLQKSCDENNEEYQRAKAEVQDIRQNKIPNRVAQRRSQESFNNSRAKGKSVSSTPAAGKPVSATTNPYRR